MNKNKNLEGKYKYHECLNDIVNQDKEYKYAALTEVTKINVEYSAIKAYYY